MNEDIQTKPSLVWATLSTPPADIEPIVRGAVTLLERVEKIEMDLFGTLGAFWDQAERDGLAPRAVQIARSDIEREKAEFGDPSAHIRGWLKNGLSIEMTIGSKLVVVIVHSKLSVPGDVRGEKEEGIDTLEMALEILKKVVSEESGVIFSVGYPTKT